MGRRKIEMKLVKNSSSRQVTFSKRRTGVFKKANELATLCGAEVAIVTFSPGGKPFSFGHPSVDAVTNRFLHRSNPTIRSRSNNGGSSGNNGLVMEKLNQQFMKLMRDKQVEKKKGKMLDKALKKNNLEGLDLKELQKLKDSLEKLKDDVNECVKQVEASSCLMLLAQKAVDHKENGGLYCS